LFLVFKYSLRPLGFFYMNGHFSELKKINFTPNLASAKLGTPENQIISMCSSNYPNNSAYVV